MKRKKRSWRRRRNLGLNQSINKRKKISSEINIVQNVPVVKTSGHSCKHKDKSQRQLRLERRNNDKELVHQFQIIQKPQEECIANLAQPDNDDTESASEGPEFNDTYLMSAMQDLSSSNAVEEVCKRFDDQNMLPYFINFMKGVASGQIPVTNISVMLAMELSRMLVQPNTTQMRYMKATTLFWETVMAVGGPRILRLFSSDKHFGACNSGQSSKSKYNPQDGSFNFAVPDEKVLRKSRTLIPKQIECGIINESQSFFKANKKYIISLDGKQAGQGLKEDGRGDVDLWGFEGPPSLKDTIVRLHEQIEFIDKLHNDVEKDTDVLCTAVKNIKIVLQMTSKRIRALREAKVRHEILRHTFNRKIQKQPSERGKYCLAFADIDAFISRANKVIHSLLILNTEWCRIMSNINETQHDFHSDGPIKLDNQLNSMIIADNDLIDVMYPGLLDANPEFIKQRTDRWHRLRAQSRITGSTMHNALGFRTLKLQKEHFDRFISHKDLPIVANRAMEHGSRHEVCIYIYIFNVC